MYDYDVKTTNNHPDVLSNVTYVDLAHRVQPEGIESDQLYDENESYRKKADNVGGEISKEKVVYATIKTEMPILPVKEMLYEKENILDDDSDDIKQPHDAIDRSYISPQKILDPTCTRLQSDDIEDLFNKKLPPIPLEESETEEEEVHIKQLIAKKIPPPVPELNSPLDLQDVEYADASDTEENVIGKTCDDTLPDEMTQDEAERLLSSRFVNYTHYFFTSLFLSN